MTVTTPELGRAPYSPKSEESLLGAALLDPRARDVLTRSLTPDDFYLPKHQQIADAIGYLHAVSAAVTPVTVANLLNERGQLANIGGPAVLLSYTADAPSSSSALTLATTIRDRAARRKLLTIGHDLTVKAVDLTVDLDDLIATVTRDTTAVDLPAGDLTPSMDIDEFLARDITYRWLVPGLLERGDRMIVTGAEGLGKSTWCRQMAVMLSAGVHLYKLIEVEPVRVLVVDVENSDVQSQRNYRALLNLVRRPGGQQTLAGGGGPGYDAGRLRIEVRPRGIDLLSRPGRRWFTERVEANEPDVIISGPLYKLSTGNPNDEGPARDLAGYFDELRARYDTALILEAHSAKSSGTHERRIEPFGASLWMRWPEFGYGLRQADDNPKIADWVPWRGARDSSRYWPSRWAYGARWPWVAERGNPDEIAPAARATVHEIPDDDEPF